MVIQAQMAYLAHSRKVDELMVKCEALMAVVKKETHDQETICAVAEVMIEVVGVSASRDRLWDALMTQETAS